jgi:hypothetical protein
MCNGISWSPNRLVSYRTRTALVSRDVMRIVGAISATDSLHLFSMVPLMGLTLPIPDHTTLRRKIDATSHRRMPASLVFDNVRL